MVSEFLIGEYNQKQPVCPINLFSSNSAVLRTCVDLILSGLLSILVYQVYELHIDPRITHDKTEPKTI